MFITFRCCSIRRLPGVLSLQVCASMLLCAHLIAPAFGEQYVGRTINGETFPGDVAQIASDFVEFKTPEASRKIPLKQLIHWGELSDSADGTQVLLADGSLIVASDVQLNDEQLIVQSQLLGEPEGFAIAGTTKLPVSSVRAILFRVPLAPLERDALIDRVKNTGAKDDQLLLANGDVVRGTFASLQHGEGDEIAGPLTVAIKTESGEVKIAPDKPNGRLLEKVTAMVFNPLLVRRVASDRSHLIIGLADGSRLAVQSVEPQGKEQAAFHLLSGAKVTSHPDVNIWEEIEFVQPLGGDNIRYLTDLTPAADSYKHTPLLDLPWPLGEDENVLGGALRAGGKLYLRGLGMHASSRVGYALDRPYRRLEAELAIDESAHRRGSVAFLVVTDAGGKYAIAYESPVIRGGDAPLPVAVDITGARRVVLAVKSADRGTEMDRANWLNVRLVQ